MDQNIITPIHGLEYWVEQMKQKIDIDGKISKTLIDSGAMISMMIKGIVTSMGMRYNL